MRLLFFHQRVRKCQVTRAASMFLLSTYVATVTVTDPTT